MKIVVESIEDLLSQTQQKSAMRAFIRENECIGCTKCIQACPVDAILGAAKQMHTVITAECIGCNLCVEPCPVDCIDMIIQSELNEEQKRQQAAKAIQRYQFQNKRLLQELEIKNAKHKLFKQKQMKIEIAQAVERAKARKAKNNG